MKRRHCRGFAVNSACSAGNSAGFTLIEILIASLIFAVSILAIVRSRTNSLRQVLESERIFQAIQVGQAKMTELELQYQKIIDRDGVKDSVFTTDGGTFDKPFELYSWTSELRESTLKIAPDNILKLLVDMGIDKELAEAQLDQDKLLLTNMNKAIKENFAEMMVTISWKEFGRTVKIPIVTHLIPLKPKITLTTNADSDAGADSSGSSAPTPTKGGG